MAILDVVQGCHVFQRLSTEQLQRIVSISREETYEGGQYVFREGERASTLHILEEGKAILEMKVSPVVEQHPAPQAIVDVVTRGEILGWSALVQPHILTTSAQAVDRCKLIALDANELIKLMDADPAMGYQVMRRLSEVIGSRLSHTRQTLLSERGLALLSQVFSY